MKRENARKREGKERKRDGTGKWNRTKKKAHGACNPKEERRQNEGMRRERQPICKKTS